jgi:hypothetical protein
VTEVVIIGHILNKTFCVFRLVVVASFFKSKIAFERVWPCALYLVILKAGHTGICFLEMVLSN